MNYFIFMLLNGFNLNLKGFTSEISDEVKKEDNMNIIKHDILRSFNLRHIIDELSLFY